MAEMFTFAGPGKAKVKEVKVKAGSYVPQGGLVFIYTHGEDATITARYKAGKSGRIEELFVKSGDELEAGGNILKLAGGCTHPTVMKDMCAECGADLKDDETKSSSSASVAMVHAIPELKVSTKEATNLGKEDQKRLLKDRKLVLLVDLDQTLIHTTNDNIPPNIRDVYHFQLYGQRSPWYHTRIRPRTLEFLEHLHPYYEFHICTFGARLYAHKIATFLDAEGKYFSHRILSRDECFDSRSKTANMSALFPCGDSMVCIIDDREDVWNFAPNLVHVKPYHFFKHTGDINAPPELSKQENDEKEGIDFDTILKKKGKKEESKSSDSKISKTDDQDGPDKTATKENTSDSNANDDDKQQVQDGKKDEDGEKKPDSDIEDVKDDLELSDSEDEEENTKKQKDDAKKDSSDDKIDVEDYDQYLYYLEEILKTIHKAYYDLYDQMSGDSIVPDLKTVVPYVKRKCLQGVNLVMSGVIPTQVPVHKSKPFLLAKSLGASVFESITSSTTHLVAARPGTAKVNEAKKRGGISIVTPDWLWACAERWSRVDETLYYLGKCSAVTMKPPAHCSSPEIAFAERCAEIEINDGYSRQHSVAESDPFLAFSSEDLQGMDKEVDDILSGESDESDDDLDGDHNTNSFNLQASAKDGGQCSSSDSEESLSDDVAPRGHKRKSDVPLDFEEDSNLELPLSKFYRGEEVPSDFEIEAEDDDEDGGGGEDWSLMGAELERELGS